MIRQSPTALGYLVIANPPKLLIFVVLYPITICENPVYLSFLMIASAISCLTARG